MNNCILLLIIGCLCANREGEVVAKTGDLLSTAILFRHGQRTALGGFKNLLCSSCRDLGDGQLTKNGSYQMYQLGEHLRAKYSSLFAKDGIFRVSNMELMSSKPDRCIMSLQSFMAGFFPPNTFEGVGQMPIKWQPISFKVDYVGDVVHFDIQVDSCPTYFEMLEEELEKPPYSSLTEANRAILAERSGNEVNTIFDIFHLADFPVTQLDLNEPVPQWLLEENDQLLSTLHQDFFRVIHANQLMLKVRAGRLITRIVENMVDVAEGRESGKEFLIYSAHDVTVNSLAYAVGVEDQLPESVLTGDTIMVDLIEDYNNGHKVQVNYFRSAEGTTFPMKIPNCKELCRLNKFISLLKNRMVTDEQRKELCGIGRTKNSSNRNLSGSGTIYICVGVGILIKVVQIV